MKNLHDKLFSRGAASLSDEELLALLIESTDDKRDALSIASSMLAQYGSLATLPRQELSRLRMVEGIGLRRAERLHLAAEYGRRVAMTTMSEVESVSTDNDVVRLMRPRVSQGGVQATVVDHRLIIKRALELLSTQIILVHNHPSGAAEPSAADKQLTQKIKAAATLFDIRVLDHIIISREGHYSFRRGELL